MSKSAVLCLLLASFALSCKKPPEPIDMRTSKQKIADGVDLINAGKLAEAQRELKAIVVMEPSNADAWFFLGVSYHFDGKLDEALKAHMRAVDSPSYRDQALYNAACVYALKNEQDKAFEFLEKAMEAGFVDLDHIAFDPDLENIRDDPRFEKLLAKYRKKNDTPEPAKAD